MKNVIIGLSIAIGVFITIIALAIFLYWGLSQMFYFKDKMIVAFCCFLISLGIIFITGNIIIS